MMNPENVPVVESNEDLARFILQRSHIRPSDQTIKPDAFIPHPWPDLSLTRHLTLSESDLWTLGYVVANQTGKKLRGRGDIKAIAFRSKNLVVTAAPIDGNPNHVNVSGWPTEKSAQKMIAQEIASNAVFVASGDPVDERS